jgi:hypothetical protein
MAPGFVPETTPLGALARDLPETALRVTWRRPTTQPSAAPFTCSVVWVGEVVHGDVNHPRIDGKDGVAGSIPAGGSTQKPQVRQGPSRACGRSGDRQLPFARDLPVRFAHCEFGAGRLRDQVTVPASGSAASSTHST